MTLQTNRYGQVVPSAINQSGTCLSTPLYISPSTEVKKALLNAFRSIRTEQLSGMGYSQDRPEGSIVVVDATAAPLTPIENELGMNEESLRLLLFGRNGLQEKLVLKLQRLTGISFKNQLLKQLMKNQKLRELIRQVKQQKPRQHGPRKTLKYPLPLDTQETLVMNWGSLKAACRVIGCPYGTVRTWIKNSCTPTLHALDLMYYLLNNASTDSPLQKPPQYSRK